MKQYIILSLVIFSFLFNCGSVFDIGLSENNIPMQKSMMCGVLDMNNSLEAGYHYLLVLSFMSILKNIILRIIFNISIISVLYILLYDKFQNYFKSTRDRYGGFVFFIQMIHLFRRGILHPKLFYEIS